VIKAGAATRTAITQWGSDGVGLGVISEYHDQPFARVQMVRFAAGGTIGTHPTGPWQVFAVVEGTGWVTAGDQRAEVTAGDVVVWEPGEEHASGSSDGMLVCIVQTTNAPALDRPDD
jgi:quercetin dioxygenase-like cupin family protein